jgi:pimeloyl-ACP methyl ester carboxylesterase
MPADETSLTLRHETVQLTPELRMHYVTAGDGEKTILLLHGFPQTWRAWEDVIPLLVSEGFRVVAPDYRGAGNTSRPVGGYDKRTMAADLHGLLKTHLRIEGRVVIVGHDIGLMVGYAYAEMFRDDVSHLVVVDAPVPGTSVFELVRADPRVWHFAFHGTRDIPEMLVAGRETQYLQAFFNARMFDPSAIDERRFGTYVLAYSAPGAMRAGFELYRAFDQDSQDNRNALAQNGKLAIPVLAAYGTISNTGPKMKQMMLEVATDVTSFCVPRTAHWIPEENPKEFVRGLVAFLSGSRNLDQN